MGDAIQEAVISLVVTGDQLANQVAAKIQGDLTSLERTGKSAEKAAAAADQATQKLQSQITETIGKLHLAVRLAERLARAANGGENSPGLSALGEGASTAVGAFRFLSPLVGPELAGVGALAAGVYTGVSKYQEDTAKEDEKAEKLAEKLSKHMERIESKQAHDDLSRIMLEQAGLSQIGKLGDGGGRFH